MDVQKIIEQSRNRIIVLQTETKIREIQVENMKLYRETGNTVYMDLFKSLRRACEDLWSLYLEQ